ncbi:hypothetical protein Tco_0704264 [Tanacetum coccineum]|uniref:Reverse transcriptase domain-containing protein n=1 Tax=Tanacetum coccineum TaxID=301880 RepID=A0ABQ4Y2V5_9ASTR
MDSEVETGLIMGVPEVMKISSFMDSVKSPELAKRFSRNIPKTVDEMMRNVEEFIRAEEAYARTELPPGESRDIHRRMSFLTGPRDVHQRLTFPTSTRNEETTERVAKKRYKGNEYKNPLQDKKTISRWEALGLQSLPYPQRVQAKKQVPVLSLALDLKGPKAKSRKGSRQKKPHHSTLVSSWSEILLLQVERNAQDREATDSLNDSGGVSPAKVAMQIRKNRAGGMFWDERFGVEGCPWKFLAYIARLSTTYFGRPGVEALNAIPSTIHSMIRFPLRRNSNLVTRRANDNRRMQTSRRKANTDGEATEGVPRRIIEHSLNVNPSLEPFCQKRRTFSPEKSEAVTNEVAEWARAGIVRPVKYPTYISNPVLVKKCDGSWRMYIDFKNLNSACPKDYYPLLNIDCKVEAVMGFKYKCFLDAYKGYHSNFSMARVDEEKTAYYTEQGTILLHEVVIWFKKCGCLPTKGWLSNFSSLFRKEPRRYVVTWLSKRKDEKDLLAGHC